MKKIKSVFISVVIAVLLIACMLPVIAGSVGDRDVLTLGMTTGDVSWTNTYEYAAVKLTRISVENDVNATNVVTVFRIITSSGTSYTQTVGAVTCVSGAGTQASLAYSGLKYGDVLSFSSLVDTGGVAILEYEVQKH